MDLTINNSSHTVPDGDPQRPLLWVLRDELGLTGTKYGCGAGVCGACTVHVGGRPVRSCVTPLGAAAGREIRTIEGLAQRAANGGLHLHPVQQAFLELQVPQCGWCMSGQMMTAAALLADTPEPSGEDIAAAMRNYCRCGCYARIRQAVTRAADLAKAV